MPRSALAPAVPAAQAAARTCGSCAHRRSDYCPIHDLYAPARKPAADCRDHEPEFDDGDLIEEHAA